RHFWITEIVIPPSCSCAVAVINIWRLRETVPKLNKENNHLSPEQIVKKKIERSGKCAQEPPRNRQGAGGRTGHAARADQVGVIHRRRNARLETWLESVRAQRVCGRPEHPHRLSAQPAVRRQAVHAAVAALRCLAAQSESVFLPQPGTDRRGQYHAAAAE